MPLGLAPAAVEQLMTSLHRIGARVVVDTSGPALASFARCGTMILKPSRNELSQHAGRPLPSVADVVDAVDDLRRVARNSALMVSLGADGAGLVTDSGPPRLITAAGGPVVSTVGAGDSLVGGLVLGLATGEGWSTPPPRRSGRFRRHARRRTPAL